jgi:hypothetical protein
MSSRLRPRTVACIASKNKDSKMMAMMIGLWVCGTTCQSGVSLSSKALGLKAESGGGSQDDMLRGRCGNRG